jgi:predicted nucleotidyltransferase
MFRKRLVRPYGFIGRGEVVMEKKWEVALNKFLEEWKDRKEVIGISVCGSYITGNPSKHSDIDINIVLKNNCNWRERGNKIVDGVLMEYFANPSWKIEEYMKEDEQDRRRVDAHMFATGRIILDKRGKMKKLKALGQKYLKKKFKKPDSSRKEILKYISWDMLDNLEEVYERKSSDFEFVYFNSLQQMINFYSEFLGFYRFSPNKMLLFLQDKKDMKKYSIPKFPDQVFAKLFVKAIKEKNKVKKMNLFKQLIQRMQLKMGGFDIDGWKVRSKVK